MFRLATANPACVQVFSPATTKSFVADTMVTLCSGAHRHLVLTLLMDKVRNHRDADHLAMAALKCTTWQKKVPESLRVANLRGPLWSTNDFILTRACETVRRCVLAASLRQSEDKLPLIFVLESGCSPTGRTDVPSGWCRLLSESWGLIPVAASGQMTIAHSAFAGSCSNDSIRCLPARSLRQRAPRSHADFLV